MQSGRGHSTGTASLKSLDKVNSLVKHPAFDIKRRVLDQNLPPLSPYSARYSGYGIERGMLCVDVAWLVLPNVQLSASHNIVFKLIINLIGKAVTSPFSLLANAFGGGADELSAVSFAPGLRRAGVRSSGGSEKSRQNTD